ncbi:hypothetical protein ACS0TY_008256 [Phlomoides rotata]
MLHTPFNLHVNLPSGLFCFYPHPIRAVALLLCNWSMTIFIRLRISYPRNKGLEQCFVAPRVSCSLENSNDGCKETELSSFSNDSQQEAVIDLKLPRRSLLVAFTCDACGERSKRLINRLAYERGLVYVQCSGCSQYHKLVDNLSLVIEYNLQDEIDSSANTDQV